MRACIKQKKSQLSVVLLPQQQPVGLYMTFPNACVSARKNMWMILGRQGSRFCKQPHHSFKVCNIKSTALAEFIGLLEPTGVLDGIFHASSCAIKSSTLFASYTRPASTSSKACWMPLLRSRFMVHPIFFDNARRNVTSMEGTSKVIRSNVAVAIIN